MSGTLRPRPVMLAVLALLTSLALLVAARSLSQYPVRQAAELRRQLATAHDLRFETRVQLDTALLQYETDNRIKISGEHTWRARSCGAPFSAMRS